MPIAEGFLADELLLRAIAEGRGKTEIAQLATNAGLSGMLVDGLAKADEGLTTDEEVLGAVDA